MRARGGLPAGGLRRAGEGARGPAAVAGAGRWVRGGRGGAGRGVRIEPCLALTVWLRDDRPSAWIEGFLFVGRGWSKLSHPTSPSTPQPSTRNHRQRVPGAGPDDT